MKRFHDAETNAETIVAYKGEDDETPYYKVDGDVFADEFYSFLIKTSRPVDDEELGQVCSLMGYRMRATVGGEGLGWPDRIAADTFVIQMDSTKGDMNHFGDFHDGLNDFIHEGTPVRKTNRNGLAGTRAIDGLPDVNVDFYSDSVISFA